MPTVLLIKAIDITKNTPLGANIDVNKYLHVIREAQVFVVEPILGTKLYDKVLADYAANTLTGDYKTIHEEYIKPILYHSVAAEYILTASYNVANGGIFKNNPENSEPVSKTEVDFLVQNQRDKADTYINRLERFLCDKNLPEYRQAQDNNYDLQPDTSDLYGGWKLD
ncbi:hypothetical protein [Flagellimonas onchidii]|uniref:DUF6712 family protein n=1 Tax=Flagellimonas onchidii TaxID=2562684 RepID=UPI0010A68D3E|nr:hypothetical protein [Allomuricauda onchidii]